MGAKAPRQHRRRERVQAARTTARARPLARRLRQAAALVREADRIALLCHIHPDGDALGSMLAAYHHLKAAGKKVWASWGSAEVQVPAHYAFLPGVGELVGPESMPHDVPLAITFDASSRERLGSLGGLVERARAVVVIDHHSSCTLRGTIDLVDEGAAASAEITYRLLEEIGGEISPEVATCLYTGLVTDTGRFQYPSARPATLELAARLLRLGAAHLRVAREVYESEPFGLLKVKARVLERAVLRPGGLIFSYFLIRDLEECGVAAADTEPLIDALRTAREAEVAALLKEEPGGGVRVSLRSRGRDVRRVAESLGGGGHELAAGYTSRGPLERALAELEERLVAPAGPR